MINEILSWLKDWWNWTKGFVGNSDANIEKVFTPNRTIRRIFGIPGEKKKAVSRVFQGVTQAALGAIPGVGPLLAGGLGALSGGQQGGIGGALLGGATGFGLGKVGAGLKGGIQNILTGPGVAAGGGLLGGTPSAVAASPFAIGGAATTGVPSTAQLFGTGFAAGAGTSLGGRLLGGAQKLAGAPATGAGAATQAPGISNLAKTILGGGLLAASTLRKPPTFETTFPERARGALAEQPDLGLAVSEMRKIALANPGELIGPASDEFINASLRQSRQAFERAKQSEIDRAGTQGRFPGKSGSLDRQVRELTNKQLQRETDFITQTNETRRLAETTTKINAVAQFYNMAQAQVANLLAIEGFITEQEATNFLAELQGFQGGQQLIGRIGGQLLSNVSA